MTEYLLHLIHQLEARIAHVMLRKPTDASEVNRVQVAPRLPHTLLHVANHSLGERVRKHHPRLQLRLTDAELVHVVKRSVVEPFKVALQHLFKLLVDVRYKLATAQRPAVVLPVVSLDMLPQNPRTELHLAPHQIGMPVKLSQQLIETPDRRVVHEYDVVQHKHIPVVLPDFLPAHLVGIKLNPVAPSPDHLPISFSDSSLAS